MAGWSAMAPLPLAARLGPGYDALGPAAGTPPNEEFYLMGRVAREA